MNYRIIMVVLPFLLASPAAAESGDRRPVLIVNPTTVIRGEKIRSTVDKKAKSA